MTVLFLKLGSMDLAVLKHQKQREGFRVVLKKTTWDITELKSTQLGHLKSPAHKV